EATAPEGVTGVVVRVSPGDHEVEVESTAVAATVTELDPATDYTIELLSSVDGILGDPSESFEVSTLSEVDTGSDVVDAASSKPMVTSGDVESLIVTVTPGSNSGSTATDASADLPVAGVDVEEAQDLGSSMARIDLSEGVSDADAAVIIDELEADPRVVSVEVDERVFRNAFPVDPPDDTYWTSNSLWGLYGSYGVGIASGRNSMNTVWSTEQGAGAVVAVLDTGYTAHPDLDANYIAGYDFVRSSSGDCRSTATNGDGDYINTGTYGALGWDNNPLDPGDWTDISSSSCDSGPSSWHGTHVAGTIGAVANNTIGIAGVAPQASIQPVRVLSFDGGWTSDITTAITWASGGTVPGVTANPTPADVINMSLGGYSPGGCSSTWQTVIDAAVARGTTIVVSAGNSNDDAALYSPANCTGVITVAATTSSGSRSYFSNYGSSVEIAAPGSGIWSTMNSGTTTPGSATYTSYSGTSMSAPHVSGVVALLRAQQPTMTPSEVLTRLQATAIPFPTTSSYQCTTSICGAGLLSAAGVTTDPIITGVTPPGGSTAGGETIVISGNNLASPTSVTLDGVTATVVSSTSTSVTATTPSHSAGAVDVAVTTASGSATSIGSFTYHDAPSISSLSVTSGPFTGGDTVVINGARMTSTTGVTFGGTAADITSVASGAVTVTTPAHAAGAVDVVVTTLGGSVTSVNAFTYLPTPTIASLSDELGAAVGGESVTITGTNFSTATQVSFGGTSASTFTVNSATSITATTPAHAAGLVDVTVTNPSGSGTSSGAYRYFDAPTASSIDVSSGSTAGGTFVVISGTDLAPADIQDSNWITVTFGGTAGTVWLPGRTSVTVSTPAHIAGLVDIVVTTPGGSSTLTNAFTYATPVVSSPPSSGGGGGSSSSSSSSESSAGGGGGGLNEITTIAPSASGPPGSVIALAGWGLATTRSVTFNEYEASWRVVSDSHVEVTVPNIPSGVYVIHAVLAPEVGRASYWAGYHVLAPTIGSAPPAATPAPGTTPPGASTSASAAEIVAFKPNSAALLPATKSRLTRMVKGMTGDDVTGTVVAFSDLRGTAKSKKVARQRAKAVTSFLESLGVTGDLTTTIDKGATSALRKGVIVRLSTEPAAGASTPGEKITSLIVRYAKGVSPTVDGKVRGSALVTGGLGTGMTLGPNLGLRMYRVDFAQPVTLAQADKAAAQMTKDKGVQFAEPDRLVSATVTKS
ncbi:MAG: S8 family serine peptidase, partial [Candidatus Nanopelagicales bacterium]|nr:S8 family serine peptidase [Candidatus Nanopelagicales bacterium]MCF8542557.1 S8 family serine peptidase [Candidatus Nanopelagicales bacterium]